MEDNLVKWWINEIIQTKTEVPLKCIKQLARKTSNFKEKFSASKGWLDKFIKRYNIE